MLEFNNPERAMDYLEHVLRLFGTTAMDHWTDADAFDIRNAIAVITDKDFGWKCIISRHSEHYMKADTFLVDVDKFNPYGVCVRMTKEPIFREFHYLSEEEEGFWAQRAHVLLQSYRTPVYEYAVAYHENKSKGVIMSTHGIITLVLVIVVVFLAVLVYKLANHMRKKQLKEAYETAANAFTNYKEQVKKALKQEEENEDQ